MVGAANVESGPSCAAEGEQLGRIDAARSRHHVARPGHQVRDRVDAAAVRHRCRIDDGIVGARPDRRRRSRSSPIVIRLRCVSITPLGRPVVPLV